MFGRFRKKPTAEKAKKRLNAILKKDRRICAAEQLIPVKDEISAHIAAVFPKELKVIPETIRYYLRETKATETESAGTCLFIKVPLYRG